MSATSTDQETMLEELLEKLGELVLKGATVFQSFREQVLSDLPARLDAVAQSVGAEEIDPFGMDPALREAKGQGAVPSLSPKARTAGTGALFFAALGVMIIGQPTTLKKWQWLSPEKEPALQNREVQIHPGELLTSIEDNKLNTVLYTGITNDLNRRVSEHKAGLGSIFTRKYNLDKLVYFELTGDVNIAIAREKQIKAGTRQKKIDLIEGCCDDLSFMGFNSLTGFLLA